MRIILVRHGRPAISTSHRTSHRGFRDYIDAYEAAGLVGTRAGQVDELCRDIAREVGLDRSRAVQPQS